MWRWTLSGILSLIVSFSTLWMGRLERMNFAYSDLPRVFPDVIAGGYDLLANPPPFFQVILMLFGFLAIARGFYLQRYPSSPLAIEFAGKISPYFEETQEGSQAIQRYRVIVRNKKHYSCISRVTLNLKKIDPQPNLLYAWPVPLRFTKNINPPFDRWCLLRERGSEFVDVVSYKPLRMRNDAWTPSIYVEHTEDGEGQEISGGAAYHIEIEAVGYGVTAISKKFCVFVENGNLKMVPEKRPLLSWITGRA